MKSAHAALLLFSFLSLCGLAPAAPSVAVLLFEDNLDFAKTEDFTGGSEIYRDEVEGLAAALEAQGVNAQVLLVPSAGIRLSDLGKFNAVYVMDAFVILPEMRTLLEKYVEAGGVLVGVHEVGRFPGFWAKPWPFGKLFGLETKPVDTWQTGVSAGPPGFYRRSAAGSDFGSHVIKVWATHPAGAEVLEVFPRYVSRGAGETEDVIHEEALPALTVHTLSRGRAVFFAPLVTDRKRGGWADAGDSVKILAGALAYATNAIVLPDEIETTEIIAGLNQVGYAPGEAKEIVYRILGDPGTQALFRVFRENGEQVMEGRPIAWPQTLWRAHYLTVNVSPLRVEDDYRIELMIPSLSRTVTNLLRISAGIASELARAQADFFEGMRCGETCHTNDPVRGGYHDGSGDYSVRMWAMPHVVYGLARHAAAYPANARLRVEFERAVDWCLALQAEDGSAWAGVHPVGEVPSPIEVRPAQDPTPREIEKQYGFAYTASYAAALARACERFGGEKRLRVLTAAENAFVRIANENADATADFGDRMWAAMELYAVTKDAVYLRAAREDAGRILPRQMTEGPWAGNFFADAARTTFNPQQWKVFHAIGIYLGLIELRRAQPDDGALREAVARFAEHLLKMAALSPYGQKAAGLEPDGSGGFVVMPFSYQGAWVHQHGLNCDLLAMATVALELFRDDGDARLEDFARRQVNWVLGCNPLGYCMVEGLGTVRFPGTDPGLGTGVIRGAIPNGISGRGAENLPSWGETWDSREYWLPQNAYFLAALSLLRN